MHALQQYGSDSDDVSSCGSGSGDATEAQPRKRRRSRSPDAPPPQPALRLPSPAALLATPAAAEPPPPPADAEADPYQGRVRAFPRVDGNFACHVYVPVQPPPAGAAALDAYVAALRAALPALHAMPPPAPGAPAMHLSLSRTVPVRFPQIASLTAALRKALSAAPPPARLPLRLPCALVNDERTRTFLALESDVGLAGAAATAAMRACFAAVDAAFVRHSLPPYYDPPRPHVSLAWALGDAAAPLAAALAAPHAPPPPDWAPPLRRVELLVGQRVTVVWGDGA